MKNKKIHNLTTILNNIEKKRIVSKNVIMTILNYDPFKSQTELNDWLYQYTIVSTIKHKFNKKEMKDLLKKCPELLRIFN